MGGLGWLMRRDTLVNDVLPGWPMSYWDEYVRRADVRLGRECLFPEVPRVKHLGLKGGASNAQYSVAWKNSVQARKVEPWGRPGSTAFKSLNRAAIPADYDLWFAQLIKNSTEISQISQLINKSNLRPGVVVSGGNMSLRYKYKNARDYTVIAKALQITPDWKESNPRASYKHASVAFFQQRKVFLYNTWPFSEYKSLDPPPPPPPQHPPQQLPQKPPLQAQKPPQQPTQNTPQQEPNNIAPEPVREPVPAASGGGGVPLHLLSASNSRVPIP